ncbi:hypothetical protein DAPPUDRAFT_301598 [Daphnia pulex]|uniref:Uncharacterized protein n=1 Tax=Daphnia pulex TaxID=6669 RepID=E9GA91_DAPPU|nr:hypothetical protein DAPPUDRAFT_301598 [Daphnia pulex]|eukprot:EFX83749.1 hypothetical protein DAPPUDRAFT_301598 [Daphnia pulex]
MFIMPVQHKGPTSTKMETSASLEVLIALATELSRARMKLRILLTIRMLCTRMYVIIFSIRTQQHISIIVNNSIFKTAFIPIILN